MDTILELLRESLPEIIGGLTAAAILGLCGWLRRRRKNQRGDQPSSMLYITEEGKSILMVQTFSDRSEWGRPAYHMKGSQRALMKVLKVYGSRTHPVPEGVAAQCIQNAIDDISALDPDIVGLGGKGRTAERIRSGLERAGSKAEIAFWGADVEIDAEQFLQRYRVEPPY